MESSLRQDGVPVQKVRKSRSGHVIKLGLGFQTQNELGFCDIKHSTVGLRRVGKS